VSATDLAVLRLERIFDAPVHAVFDAWTNPEVLRRWWSVDPTWSTTVAEVDLRTGGSYRLSMQDPNEDAPHESTVTVRFLPEGERTRVTLEHTGLPSPESRDRHGEGWAGCIASHQRLLEGRVNR
jgi:uncharacterized protein YndB with AHSA1/START domain